MKKWIKYGLIWALCMLTGMGVVFPLLDGTFSAMKLLIALPIFLAFGLLWGYFMFGRKTAKKITS